MKLTLPQNPVLASVIFISTIFAQICDSEPFVSRSSITPVKLVKGNNSRNRSAIIHKQDEHVKGSVVKINRVVPLKRLTKQSSKIDSKPSLSSQLPRTEKLVANHHAEVKKLMGSSESKPVSSGHNNKKQASLQSLSTTTTTKRPLVLSANSWEYLNSVVTDEELRKVINDLPEEVISKATDINRKDPVAGQNYLFNSILDQLSLLKFPRNRMLGEEEEQNEKKVNNGVRFSAKRRPVLNVMAPVMEIDVKNISGHITNIEKNSPLQQSSNLEKPGKIDFEHVYEEYEDTKKSTTPSVMNVIAAPDKRDPYSTTPFSPSISSDSKTGFVPVIHLIPPTNSPLHITIQNLYTENKTESVVRPPSVRKARGPPKEANYLIPPITSSTSPETVNAGYQTIPESTTPGPKTVWYSHNQTPEDTFFPNSDGYLVPPEESSLEFLTDLALLLPKGSSENQIPTSLEKDDSKHSASVMKGLMKENGSGGGGGGGGGSVIIRARSNKNSRFPESSKKHGHLQTAATDHEIIRDNEDYSKNGGSGGEGRTGRNGYRYKDDGKQPFSSSYRNHELPPYQEINGNPEDYVGGYGAYKVVDHYHPDTYPNKHEISQYHGSGGDLNRPQNNFNGNYPVGLNNDGDYGKRPDKSSKQNSYVSGYGHGNSHQPFSYGHHGGGGGDGKDPSKDFFDLAKDYFKHSDLRQTEKWFDITIGVLAFLAFGGYIIMLLYQVFTVSSGTRFGMLIGRSYRGAGEVFDTFFSKGPIGQAYMDELETIVKKAMANVKRIWTTNSIGKKETPKVKGEVDAN